MMDKEVSAANKVNKCSSDFGSGMFSDQSIILQKNYIDYLIIFVYLSSLPVAHLSEAPRRRLVVTGDSARIQDETTENSAWFFNVLGV